MDGVVADFDKFALSVLGEKEEKTHEWPPHQWAKLSEYPRLYRDLPKTPESDELISYCTNFAETFEYELFFLTAIPKGNDVKWAFYDKMNWVRDYYSHIPVMFGPYSKDKQHHCKPGDILIDDRPSNIAEWTNAGGIAIRHIGDLQNTINELQKVVA